MTLGKGTGLGTLTTIYSGQNTVGICQVLDILKVNEMLKD
jgi:hypothetical protein